MKDEDVCRACRRKMAQPHERCRLIGADHTQEHTAWILL